MDDHFNRNWNHFAIKILLHVFCKLIVFVLFLQVSSDSYNITGFYGQTQLNADALVREYKFLFHKNELCELIFGPQRSIEILPSLYLKFCKSVIVFLCKPQYFEQEMNRMNTDMKVVHIVTSRIYPYVSVYSLFHFS